MLKMVKGYGNGSGRNSRNSSDAGQGRQVVDDYSELPSD